MKQIKRPPYLVMHAINQFRLAAVCVVKRRKRHEIVVTASPWGKDLGEVPPLFVGWCSNFESAKSIARAAIELSSVAGHVPQPGVHGLIHAIRIEAKERPEAQLTDHAEIVVKATSLVAKIEAQLRTLQDQGQLSYFNAGYKDYRLKFQANRPPDKRLMTFGTWRRGIVSRVISHAIHEK